MNFGYSRSAYWLALTVGLDSTSPSRWLLEIAYPSLDRVEVYQPTESGKYDEQIAGDLQPFRSRLYPHRNLVFPLLLVPGKTQTVFMRVTSRGNLTVPATLWQPEALHQHDQSAYAGLSLYYGLMLALLTYSLLLFLSTREWVFIAYVAFVASMAVGMSSMNGFGNQFLWPNWPQWGNVALPSGMSAAGFFGALFTRLFLGSKRNFPKFDRLLVVLAFGFAFSAVSPAFVSYQFAAIFTSITGITFAFVACRWGLLRLEGTSGRPLFPPGMDDAAGGRGSLGRPQSGLAADQYSDPLLDADRIGNRDAAVVIRDRRPGYDYPPRK